MPPRLRIVGAGIAILLVSAGVALLIATRGQHADGDVRSGGPAVKRSAAASKSPSVAPSPAPSTAPTPARSAPPVPAASPRPSPKAPIGPQPIERPPLTVLNNSTIIGLGASAAARFRSAGWLIADVDGISGRYRFSTVYYGPGQIDAARSLMRQFPAITVIEPRSRYANLPGAGLTVVVTRDFA